MRRIKVPAESKTASKATRDFFEILDHSGVPRPIVAEKAGIHVNNFYGWMNGRISATITNMEAALAVLGMEFCIRPIQRRQPWQRLLSDLDDRDDQTKAVILKMHKPFAHLDL